MLYCCILGVNKQQQLQKTKRKQFDMFADEKDEFEDPVARLHQFGHLDEKSLANKNSQNHQNSQSHLIDNWDDSEGYYRKLLNEFIMSNKLSIYRFIH